MKIFKNLKSNFVRGACVNFFPATARRSADARGFTLIEVLMVSSMISMIGLALFQALSNGIDIWKRADRFATEEDVAIFLEKLTRDLRNGFNYSLLDFNGKSAEIIVPTLVQTKIELSSGKVSSQNTTHLGLVKYVFRKADQRIVRLQANYGKALKGKFEKEREVAHHIRSLSFSYFLKEKEGKSLKKLKAQKGVLPQSVLVELDFQEDTGGVRRIVRLIEIPIYSEKDENKLATAF